MNVIFLTMSSVRNISDRRIYQDLLRKFRAEGHEVYIVTPRERRLGESTALSESDGAHILGVKTLNLQKSSIIEKGIGQVLVESQFKKAIQKHLPGVKFDLILYSTPPITLKGTIEYLKKKNPQAISYLLLKDIFPQNAVDIGMMTKTGVKGLLYKFFRRKEKALYAISDYIGCMSPANVDYVLKHNPEVSPLKVEEAPNSYEFFEVIPMSKEEKSHVRHQYSIPADKPAFLYGGNLGKPQGIPFLINCLDALKNRADCHFLVVGSGTEADKFQEWLNTSKAENVTFIPELPVQEYHQLVRSCDVGMIFLDHRFTIPNFPSRALDYMRYSMPLLLATDSVCDMGPIAENNGFGFWCESRLVSDFVAIVDKMLQSDRMLMGQKAYDYLRDYYSIDCTYNAIVRHV